MHPELEFFLESAVKSIQPTSAEIGRVVLEPDYDVDPERDESGELTHELKNCIAEQKPEPEALASHEGFPVPIGEKYPVLAKYARSITLYADRIDGPWVEIAPPGNWI